MTTTSSSNARSLTAAAALALAALAAATAAHAALGHDGHAACLPEIAAATLAAGATWMAARGLKARVQR